MNIEEKNNAAGDSSLQLFSSKQTKKICNDDCYNLWVNLSIIIAADASFFLSLLLQ